MKRTVALVCVAMTASACGGGDDASPLVTVPPVTESTNDQTTDPTAAPTTTSTVPSTPPTTSAPGSAAPETVPGERPAAGGVETALLPDEAFGAPWEPQRRSSDGQTFSAGPNQTTCEQYWTVEELRGIGGAHAMWWRDGGNANHRVGPSNVPLTGLATLADDCPTVKWLEGGSFAVESIPVDDGYGFRFVESESRQVTWFGVTERNGLVSILDMPLWTDADGQMPAFSADDLRALLTEMRVRLAYAEATTTIAELQPTTTTTTTTSVQPATPQPPPPPEPLPEIAALLLTIDDLPPGFDEPNLREFTHSSPDEELEAICPAATSIAAIDEFLAWTLSSDHDDGFELEQIVGRADTSAVAAELVRRFAGIAACDLSDSYGEEVTTSGGEVAAAGADAASHLRIEGDHEPFAGDLVLLAVDDVVLIVSIEAIDAVALDAFDLDGLVAIAVDRVRSIEG